MSDHLKKHMLIRNTGGDNLDSKTYTSTSLQTNDCIIIEGLPQKVRFMRKVNGEYVNLYFERFQGLENVSNSRFTPVMTIFKNEHYFSCIHAMLSASNLIAKEIPYEQGVTQISNKQPAEYKGNHEQYYILCKRS